MNRFLCALFMIVLVGCRSEEVLIDSSDASSTDANDVFEADVQDSSPVDSETDSQIDSGPSDSGYDSGDSGYVPLDSGSEPIDSGPPDYLPEQKDPNTIWGIIGTGQSLSVGAHSNPVINTTTRYNNLKLEFQYVDVPWTSTHQLTDLGEPIRNASAGSYPYNIWGGGESPHTSMADQISYQSIETSGSDYVTIHTVVGQDNYGYEQIKKNGLGNNYQSSLDEMSDVKSIVSLRGKNYKIGAIVLTHGERDYSDSNYGNDIFDLWSDYNTDIKLITGQTNIIPLITSQSSSGYPNSNGSRAISSWKMWESSVMNSGIVCSGPKYQYDYFSDGIHFTAPSSQRLGVKYGQVYDTLRKGIKWKPLQPNDVKLIDSKTISITFDVPVPPIQFDESLEIQHTIGHEWYNGRGFELVDDVGLVRIDFVTLSGPDKVLIHANREIDSGAVLGYAMTVTQDGTRRVGQLCDSDNLDGVDSKEYRIVAAQNSNSIIIIDLDDAHGPRDILNDSGVAPNTVIKSISGVTAILSNPWTKPDQIYDVKIKSDQRNYLVQFDWKIN